MIFFNSHAVSAKSPHARHGAISVRLPLGHRPVRRVSVPPRAPGLPGAPAQVAHGGGRGPVVSGCGGVVAGPVPDAEEAAGLLALAAELLLEEENQIRSNLKLLVR